MKTYIPYSLILAAASAGMAFGAETAYTTPVGYSTTTLSQGFNHIGLTLQLPTKAAGDFEVAGATSVQDTTAGVNFTTSLGATGTLHILEITSGPKLGLVSEISSWTADTITTVDDLSGIGAAAKYRIRKAPTLEEIFTTNTTTGPLTAGAATTADIVFVPTAVAGQFDQYFLSTAGAFRKISPAGLAPNVPVVYLDGLLIQRKATGTKDLVVSGELKTDKTSGVLLPGFNSLGNIYPVGSTVQNSGLENYLLAGAATTADLIYVPTTPGQYLQVFRSTAGTWRTVSPAGVAATVDFKTGMYIQRKGAKAAYTINVPSTWSGL